jgi:hypothetical protein
MSAAIDHRDMTGHLTWSAAPAPEGSVADLIAASERRAADQGQAPEIDAERVALQAPGRRRARVCGDCWYVLRPDQYLPGDTYGTDGECSMCGGWAYALHRVAWAEIDAERAVDRERAMHRFPQD